MNHARQCMRKNSILRISQRALLSGFTPIINSMAATGVVSLPGIMKRQMLARVDQQKTAKYQMLMMFSIGAGRARSSVYRYLAIKRQSGQGVS